VGRSEKTRFSINQRTIMSKKVSNKKYKQANYEAHADMPASGVTAGDSVYVRLEPDSDHLEPGDWRYVGRVRSAENSHVVEDMSSGVVKKMGAHMLLICNPIDTKTFSLYTLDRKDSDA
jgi:hypothetical protein